jgi:hypothetical protein
MKLNERWQQAEGNVDRMLYVLLEHTVDELIRRANHLSNDMRHLAVTLEDWKKAGAGVTAPEQPLINSLGEVQSSGPEIDRLCGVFGTLIKLCEAFEHDKKMSEK